MGRRPTALLALALALAATYAAPAHAAFTLTAPGAAAFSFTLTGVDATASYTLPLTVVDTRATPTAGWHLTIRATQFSAAGGTKTLPTTSDSVTSVARVCSTGPCVNPTNSIGMPVAVPNSNPASTFYNAAATTGTGTFTITPTVAVSIPANTLTGSYTSTVTTTLVTGP